MSSPFQRAFSSKSPLKEPNYHDPESKDHNPSRTAPETATNRPRFTSPTPVDPPSKKPSMMDIATGPMQSSGARLLWETGKKIYQAIDTPQERAAIKSKIKEAWKNIKGPRSIKVGN